MVRKVRTVYECPDCMGIAEAIRLTALGGKVREYFRDRDGRPSPGVVIRSVLCWWCREMHSPGEVSTCMVLPRKTSAVAGSGSSTSKSLGAGPLEQYSELWAFLTAIAYPDGQPRKTGRLSVSCESDLLKVSLTCDETASYATLSGRNLLSILEEIELRLTDGSLTFKPSKYARSGRPGK